MGKKNQRGSRGKVCAMEFSLFFFSLELARVEKTSPYLYYVPFFKHTEKNKKQRNKKIKKIQLFSFRVLFINIYDAKFLLVFFLLNGTNNKKGKRKTILKPKKEKEKEKLKDDRFSKKNKKKTRRREGIV